MSELELTVESARRIGLALGVDWEAARFDPDEYRAGIQVELRQVSSASTGISDDDELAAFRAALANLEKCPDHYSRAEQREAELRAYSESL